MKKRTTSFLLAVLCTVSLAGCASAPASSAASSMVPASSVAESKGDHYPVTITTYNYAGEEITTTYEKAPERVLAVYQGCIETMVALGLEDHVAASYGLDNEVKEEWKSGFKKMHYEESVFAPDKETVTLMQPDLIFSWGSIFGEKKLGDVNNWIDKGTNTYMNTNTRSGGGTRTLENEYADLLNIGKIFNVEDKAQALVDEIKSEITDALAQAKGKPAQTVALIEFFGDDTSNYGSGQLASDMVTQLGGTLAFPDADQLGKEDLIAKNPEIIFVVYMAYSGDAPDAVRQESLDKLLKNPAYASLSAIQNNRVYPVMLGDIYASAVRTIDGVRTLAQGMYPELAR